MAHGYGYRLTANGSRRPRAREMIQSESLVVSPEHVLADSPILPRKLGAFLERGAQRAPLGCEPWAVAVSH